jgi:hypothetical protein
VFIILQPEQSLEFLPRYIALEQAQHPQDFRGDFRGENVSITPVFASEVHRGNGAPDCPWLFSPKVSRTLGAIAIQFHPSIIGIIFGDPHAFLLLFTQQFHTDRCAQGFGDPSEHAQGMTFVGR